MIIVGCRNFQNIQIFRNCLSSSNNGVAETKKPQVANSKENSTTPSRRRRSGDWFQLANSRDRISRHVICGLIFEVFQLFRQLTDRGESRRGIHHLLSQLQRSCLVQPRVGAPEAGYPGEIAPKSLLQPQSGLPRDRRYFFKLRGNPFRVGKKLWSTTLGSPLCGATQGFNRQSLRDRKTQI